VIRVHALDTGRVKLHQRQLVPHPRDALRLPATLLDRSWTDWLAIWSFAIEHPEGVVVVDAGQDPDFVTPRWDLYGNTAVKFEVGEADRLQTRLREVGIDPSSVRHHVFTHLHVDHVGAGTLPGATAVLQEEEWRVGTRRGARLRGYIRAGIEAPTTVHGDHDLYGDGSIRLLHTPGHTPGHQSVLVTPTDGPPVLIAGDAAYSEDNFVNGRNDGVVVDPKQARATIARLQDLCRQTPTVVAPTHDVGSAARIAAGQTTAV
jgi:glyoxylase-like metal-dependent hydrolase (beta-lactamase superfamily II)